MNPYLARTGSFEPTLAWFPGWSAKTFHCIRLQQQFAGVSLAGRPSPMSYFTYPKSYVLCYVPQVLCLILHTPSPMSYFTYPKSYVLFYHLCTPSPMSYFTYPKFEGLRNTKLALKGNQTQDASSPENVENVPISSAWFM